MTPTPPPPTTLLTALITTLSHPPSPSTSQPTTKIPPHALPLLQTLHTLLPHTLLDTLDLLDRGCVTRLSIPTNDETTRHRGGKRRGYFVTSAPLPLSGPAGVPLRVYHVHVRAWHCGCPAFALAAFGEFGGEEGGHEGGGGGVRWAEFCRQGATGGFRFGGLSRGLVRSWGGDGDAKGRDVEVAPPVCKHLLAAVLAEECGWLFEAVDETGEEDDGSGDARCKGRKGVREVEVGVEEMARWVADGGGSA
ncbi:MAG: hypothetical protein M1828_004870 [Chrysothrix sp. TS-e1954]|nr:MAG: hypothetical protein M1828_004870 [Chrysothrix sp. TS-e1954]